MRGARLIHCPILPAHNHHFAAPLQPWLALMVRDDLIEAELDAIVILHNPRLDQSDRQIAAIDGREDECGEGDT